MLFDIFELVLRAGSAAFIDVTSFVGAVLILFGIINYKKGGGLIASIAKKKRWQPVIGAFLGVTPGCGGAILIMPLYTRRVVTFGTVVATLIATAGDSAFVLIASSFSTFLYLSGICFVVGLSAGYLVDYLKIGPRFLKGEDLEPEAVSEAEKLMASGCHCADLRHIGHLPGDEIEEILHHKAKHHQPEGTLGFKITHGGYLAYWLVILIGLGFGVLNLFNFQYGEGLLSKFVLYFGVFGIVGSVILMLAGKKYFSDDTHEEEELKMMSLRETFIHNAQEVAFVGTWVFLAYVVYEIAIYTVGGGDYAHGEALFQGLIGSVGPYAILIAALVGMIPGCGPQIIFVTLYTKGLFPFAALLTHAISQDGDALFPLLAMNKKASLLVTVITTIVALVVGGAWLFFGGWVGGGA